MDEIMRSEDYTKAVELHQKIVVNAQLAQNSLYEACAGLKEMRDSRLYKELGYQNFDSYCETEVGLQSRQAYRYISIAEKFGDVTPVSHLGVAKLYLLSTLPEDEREQVMQEVDVEQVSKRELEKVVQELKAEREEAEKLEQALEEQKNQTAKLEKDAIKKDKEIQSLQNRPVEVAVKEPNKETIDKAVKKQVDQIHIQKQDEINRIKELYDAKIKELSEQGATADHGKEAFKAYFTAAYDSFSRLIQFTEKAENNSEFVQRIRTLLNTLADTVDKLDIS